jgi:hypothetical protein
MTFVLSSVGPPWWAAIVQTLIGALIALLSTLGVSLITEHIKRTQTLNPWQPY